MDGITTEDAESVKVILASSSPRRTQLLAQIGVEHEVMVPETDESYPAALNPGQVVETLALRKAWAVAKPGVQAWVIGADTIVVKDGDIYGKPQDASDAKRMLRVLQGQRHEVFTGVAVLDAHGRSRIGHRRVNVDMAPVDERAVVSYVQSGEPLDKAGAYSVQGSGARFVERIEGDYYAVVGLPLSMVARFLTELGYHFSG
ncbi:MAG: Maf family protein [Bacilli bacterium]